MGNHEYMALQCLPWLKTEITDHTVEMLNEEKINGLLLWIYNGGLKSIEGFKLLSEQQQDNVIDYLRKLPLYKELWINEQHYILVHAGLEHFQKEKALSKYSVKELVWPGRTKIQFIMRTGLWSLSGILRHLISCQRLL